MSERSDNLVYKVADTCQIKNLNEIYLSIFGYKEDGVFVEVGAHDGYSFSNTWGLAEAGWRGLYFEPVPELYEKCVAIHSHNPKVTVMNRAIGDKLDPHGILHVDKNNILSAGASLLVEYPDDIEVTIIPLSMALSLKDIPYYFDLLVVDVEGAEKQVLDGMDFMRWRPTLMIIERYSESISGYSIIQDDKLNTIYRRDDA
jgi:FkbM family methyltransferase